MSLTSYQLLHPAIAIAKLDNIFEIPNFYRSFFEVFSSLYGGVVRNMHIYRHLAVWEKCNFFLLSYCFKVVEGALCPKQGVRRVILLSKTICIFREKYKSFVRIEIKFF